MPVPDQEEVCPDCQRYFCECAWIDIPTEEGDGPEEFLELEKPSAALPLVFPDGFVGSCRIDPATGHIIVTSANAVARFQ